jgi:hypothetical protein
MLCEQIRQLEASHHDVCALLNRCFVEPDPQGVPTVKLIPFMDMLNHHSTGSVAQSQGPTFVRSTPGGLRQVQLPVALSCRNHSNLNR